jgi:hypothetical protein
MQLPVNGDLPDALALAVDPQHRLAGGAGHVVDVQGDDLSDAGTGIERDEAKRLVPGRRAGLYRPEVADLSTLVERTRCGHGDLDTGGAAGPKAPADVEVVDCGEGVVHGCRAALRHGLEVGAVVPHGPVPAVGGSERVSVHLGGAKPDQELADP